jgi:imidazolonepropionase-like amidohydrolase
MPSPFSQIDGFFYLYFIFLKMKKHYLLFLLLALCGQAAAQTQTFPRDGVQDQRVGMYAFTNATLVEASGITENATLLVKGAFIEAAGKNVAIPAGAVVIDCRGKRIYPGLIDVYSDYGMPEIKRSGGGGRQQQTESMKKGAYGWNQAVMPENDAATLFTNPNKGDEWRKMGFGAVIAHPHDGIVRGSGALIALLDGRDQDALLKSRTSGHFSFAKGSSTQDYPNSIMGSRALLLQTFLDAEWYKKALNKTETNLSLESLNAQQGLPLVFEAADKLAIFRAHKLGDESGNQFIIRSGGDEYQRVEDIKATGVSLIVPLNFPTAPDVEDPFDAAIVSVGEMKHWEMAPANAAILQKAGINFALTTSLLRSKSDFWGNLRKAIEYGLDKNAALAALTSNPAKMLRVDNLVGGLKSGLLANFLITSDDLFSKDNVILENWVKGRPHILSTVPNDIRGSYQLSLGKNDQLRLSITGKVTAPEYQIIVNDSTKFSPKVTRSNDAFTMVFKADKKAKGDTRISAYLDGQNIVGNGYDGDGQPIQWKAVYKEAMKPDTAKKKEEIAKIPEMGKRTFPFVGLGNEQMPQAENMLFKNATVWTNEKEGILAGMDVLVQNGKIAQVGKNLTAPAGTQTIDATGKHLTNGIFDEHSHIALLSVNEGSQSVTSEVRMADAINSEDVNIYRQLAGGVTTSQLLHGSANSIGGQSAVVKLKWGETPEKMVIANTQFIKFALGENVKQSNWGNQTSRFPQTRMGVEQIIRDAFIRAKEYKKTWDAYNKAPNKASLVAPRRDLELEAVAEILDGKRHITCHSYVQSEINMLMKVADELGFKVNTFTHILEGYKVADNMAKHGANGSSFSDWWGYKMEVKDAIPYNPVLMQKAGVTVAINSDDAEMARRLNQEAAKSVLYGGMSEEDAWKMVTLNPAKMMKLDGRIGSIKAGKDADLVLWNNNPLSIYAKPLKTIIEGVVYFDVEKDAKKQVDVAQERNRLVQKLLAAKGGGTPTQKPEVKRPRTYGCAEGEASHFYWYRFSGH